MTTSTLPRAATAWLWASTAARLALATVWLAAGGTKVGDLAASARAVSAYQLMPYEAARVVGAVLPFVEIGLGLLLLVGLAVRFGAAVSATLLAVFIAAIASAASRGLTIDCGCFGTGGQLAAGQTPTYAADILRDAGLAALAGLLLWRPESRFSVDTLLER